MAKGQLHSNREPMKPKQPEKVVTMPSTSTVKPSRTPAATVAKKK